MCKDLEIHLLELSKFDVPVEEVKTPLQRWLYFFTHGASLEPDKLPATLDVPMIRKAVEVLVKISQSEREREWALERERAERDALNLAASARVAQEELRAAQDKLRGAEEEGRRAHQQGVEKGRIIGRISLLQQMLQQAETPADELARRTEEELRRLEESLQQQFAGTKDANGAPPGDKK